ncbi:MAG: hypothetical protein E7434_03785 [Ruminococcaceae bacterium]|nr:hypothetical protein [Oscillospiraceae bacterium]
MDFSTILSDVYSRNILILTGVYMLAAIFLVPAYFVSLRPVRGTTEWMTRIDQPEFEPLSLNKFRWSDLPFALLSGVCAALLRMASFLCIYLHHGILPSLERVLPHLITSYLLPCAVLGIAVYLLLHSMFDSTLPAICVAILSGLMQIGNAWAAAFTMLSLLFLWLWTALDADSGLLVRALTLLAALVCYGLALLRYWALLWLLPLFLAAYIYAQIYRWRKTSKKGRGMRLGLSLLFLFFTFFAAFVAAWAYYCCHKMHDPALMLDIRLSLQVVFEELFSRLSHIRFVTDPLAGVLVRDAIFFLLGAVSLIPVVHGIIRWRDSQCIMLLSLIPCFVGIWLLGGMYLLVPMLALLLGWVLSVFAKRENSWLVIVFTVIPAITFLAEHFI